jgi:hypothetical protein
MGDWIALANLIVNLIRLVFDLWRYFYSTPADARKAIRARWTVVREALQTTDVRRVLAASVVTLALFYGPTLLDWITRLRDALASLRPDTTGSTSVCSVAGETQSNVFDNMHTNDCDSMMRVVNATDSLRIRVFDPVPVKDVATATQTHGA